MLPIVLFFIVLTTYIYCIIHCLRNHALEYNSRLLWVIIIFLIPFFGGILYLTMGKNGDESRRQFQRLINDLFLGKYWFIPDDWIFVNERRISSLIIVLLSLTNRVQSLKSMVRQQAVQLYSRWLYNWKIDERYWLTDMLKAKDRNTVEFMGIWEPVNNSHFNYGEFAIIKSQARLFPPLSGIIKCGAVDSSQIRVNNNNR